MSVGVGRHQRYLLREEEVTSFRKCLPYLLHMERCKNTVVTIRLQAAKVFAPCALGHFTPEAGGAVEGLQLPLFHRREIEAHQVKAPAPGLMARAAELGCEPTLGARDPSQW